MGPWPHAAAPGGGSVDLSIVPDAASATGREMGYLSDFGGDAWYAIASPDLGFAMRWDAAVFKYLWLWQEFTPTGGYPWWNRVYTVALEPWTSFPTLGLPEAVRRGTQLVLRAGETKQTSLVATSFVPAGRVSAVGVDGVVTFDPEGPEADRAPESGDRVAER
jgi:hypothetical protein